MRAPERNHEEKMLIPRRIRKNNSIMIKLSTKSQNWQMLVYRERKQKERERERERER